MSARVPHAPHAPPRQEPHVWAVLCFWYVGAHGGGETTERKEIEDDAVPPTGEYPRCLRSPSGRA